MCLERFVTVTWYKRAIFRILVFRFNVLVLFVKLWLKLSLLKITFWLHRLLITRLRVSLLSTRISFPIRMCFIWLSHFRPSICNGYLRFHPLMESLYNPPTLTALYYTTSPHLSIYSFFLFIFVLNTFLNKLFYKL